MNNIKIGVDIDTSNAKEEFKQLGKLAEKTKNSIQKRTAPKGGRHNETSSDDSMLKIARSFEKTSKAIEDSINRLTKSLGNIPKGTGSNKTTDSPTPTINKPTTVPDNGLGKIANILGSLVAAGGAINYVSGGMNTAKHGAIDSSRIYNRLDGYGNDFYRARQDAARRGKQFGYNANESMSLEDRLVSSTGFSNRNNLGKDTSSFMGMARSYGLNAESMTESFGNLVKAGAFSTGQGEDYTNLLSGAIKANNMQGREDEVVRSIETLSDTLTSNNLHVTSDDFKHLVNLHTTLGKIDESLKGQKGAQMIQSINGGMNRNDPMLQMLMGAHGGDLGYGFDAQWKAMEMLDKGITNPETFEAYKKNIARFGGFDSTKVKMAVSQKHNLSVAETEQLFKAFKSGTVEDVQGIGKKDKQSKLENIQSSNAFKNQQYDINKENAQSDIGNKVNDTVMPAKELYNKLPVGAQGGIGIGASMLGGAVVSQLGKYVLGGGNILKGVGGLANGLKSGVGALGSNAMALAKLTGSSLSDNKFRLLGAAKLGAVNVSKGVTGILGKAAPYVPMAMAGFEAVDNFSKGENREGVKSIGGGVGGLAGAKLGAIAGTAVLPVIGTAIGAGLGGIGGYLAGKFLGGKAYDVGGEMLAPEKAFADENTKKEKTLLDKQEMLLKKEEMLFDKYLGESKDTKKFADDKDSKKFVNGNEPGLVKPDDDVKKYLEERNQAMNSGSSDSSGSASAGVSFGGSVKGGLGSATREYEVGANGNGGMVSSGANDPYGGISYGIPQFSTIQGSAKSFVNSLMKSNPEYQKYFSGKTPGTKAFGSAWKQAYADKGEDFERLQLKYSQDTHYNPWVKAANKNNGVDFNRSRALQEVAWSMAVQHGPNSTKRYLPGINGSMTDEQIIKQIYKNRNAWATVKTSKRWKQEEKKLLGLLGQSAVPLYATGIDRVDRDKLAILHKDEAVLSKFDAKDYREGSSNGVGRADINLNLNINASSGVSQELINMVKLSVSQAIQQLNNTNSYNLNKMQVRTQN